MMLQNQAEGEGWHKLANETQTENVGCYLMAPVKVVFNFFADTSPSIEGAR